ncbi:MAG: S41 family peptidase [Alistipes sp.]|nr:S41 family peptidase [Alistipes sp.]
MGTYSEDNAIAIGNDLKKSKAIIADFRDYTNPKTISIIWYCLLPWETHVTTVSLPKKRLPGYFYTRKEYWGGTNCEFVQRYKGKIVALVNERTQSSAEYCTMALQSIPHTIVIGSQTSGADGNVVINQLPGPLQIIFSGLGVYYPDGTPTQRVGVRIDEVVNPTLEGVKAGRDEVLERAIEILNEK